MKQNKTLKMHVVLAKTEHLAKTFNEAVQDYIKFFKDKQGAFKGERRTFEPAPGTIDQPGKRVNKLVVTTVDEKLQWLENNNLEYIDMLFAQEATNASGKAKAELIVEGKSWGEYSSLELLRLKSFLESTNFSKMYEDIPVRNDDEIWKETNNEYYSGRSIFETSLLSGDEKSTLKEQYILPDPNLNQLKDASGYKPMLANKDTIITLGTYTHQRFSGEWSHRQRAELLRRKTVLLNAVIEALKIANDVEIVDSQLTAKKLFSYLHQGN